MTETPLHGPDPALDSTAQQRVQACVRWCGMDGAAVVVGLGAAGPPSTHGRAVVYSTNPVASAVADLQFVLGCGPHRESMTENTISFANVGDADDRWPLLTAELAAVGVRSVCSAPLVTDDVGAQLPLGTLQLHSTREVRIPDRALHLLSMTARRLHTHLVSSTPAAAPSRERTARGEGEFDAGAVNTVVGVLIARHGVDAPKAETLLRACLRARNQFHRRRSTSDRHDL